MKGFPFQATVDHHVLRPQLSRNPGLQLRSSDFWGSRLQVRVKIASLIMKCPHASDNIKEEREHVGSRVRSLQGQCNAVRRLSGALGVP